MEEMLEQMQLNLQTNESNSSSVREEFGCCSRYRACSDAGACQIPDLDYSNDCIYRKRLEKGKVYYGKHASNYRHSAYQHFAEQYSQLSNSEAAVLCEILHYFFIKKQWISTAMFKITDIAEYVALEKAGFLQLTTNPERVVNICRKGAMVDACGSHIQKANQWAKEHCSSDKWKGRKTISKKDIPAEANIEDFKSIKIYREELAQWILQFSPETARKLSKNIYFIEIGLDGQQELYEFFLDTMYREDFEFSLDTGENDIRFLAQR